MQPDKGEALRFAVSSMLGPTATYDLYAELLSALAEDAGAPFTLVQRRTYQEMNDLILRGQIDLAFICSGALVSLPPDANVELLAMPVVGGEPHYRSLIITRTDHDLTSLADLEGKRFAFTDSLSHTGYFYPLSRLSELGTTPAQHFSETMFTGSHDKSIAAVYRGLADAAAVHSIVFEQVAGPHSRYSGKLKVIEESAGFATPPVVVPRSLDPELRRLFRRRLLHLHETRRGRQILQAMGLDRFVAAKPEDYATVRSVASRARSVLAQEAAAVSSPHRLLEPTAHADAGHEADGEAHTTRTEPNEDSTRRGVHPVL